MTHRATIALRIVIMAVGVFLLGAGIGLSRVSTLGVSPISAPAAVGSSIAQDLEIDFITMGMLSFLMNFSCFIVELVILKRAFNPWQFLQIPALLIMTSSIDIWIFAFSAVEVDSMLMKSVILVVALLLVSLGIHMEVFANVVMCPGDAMVAVLSYVSKKPYSKIKVWTDCGFVLVGLVVSLLYFRGLVGIGIGTVASALCVGYLIKFWGFVLRPVERRLAFEPDPVVPSIVPKTY